MSYAVVAAGIFEVMYIFLQAARGRESHFNNTTVVESVMYGFMGVGAVILVLGSFYLGWLLYREYQSERNKPRTLVRCIRVNGGLNTDIDHCELHVFATGQYHHRLK